MDNRKSVRTLKSVAEVIKALGGPRAICLWSGALETSIGNWKRQGYIPAPWFLVFTARLAERGYSVSPRVFGFKKVPQLQGEARQVA